MCGWYWLMLVDVGWLVVGTGWVMVWFWFGTVYWLVLVGTGWFTGWYLLFLVITCWYFVAVTVVFT